VKTRPQTTIILTDKGREHFVDYLQALEEVLLKAAESVSSTLPVSLQKTVKA